MSSFDRIAGESASLRAPQPEAILCEGTESGPQRGKSVIVIGGGLAGIAAALALARHGVQVRLLEARRRLGGRASSFEFRNSGQQAQSIDYCQHVAMGCCTNLQQLIDWLDQRRYWTLHRELHFFGVRGEHRRLAALPGLPAPLHLTHWLLRWPELGIADRLQIARVMLAIYRLDRSSPKLDVPAQEWLIARGQSLRSLDHFWSTIVVSALGEQLSQVSLAAVVKVMQEGFLQHRDAFHLWIPQRPLEHLFGQLAATHLEAHGVEVLTSRPAAAVSDWNSRQMTVHSEGGESWQASGVVVAVPWHRLPHLRVEPFSPRFAEACRGAAQLKSSPITGVHTWWDRAWLRQPHAAIVGRLCQWVFPPPADMAPETTSGEHYYQIVISASRGLPRGDPQQTARLIHEDLSAVFPEVTQSRLLRCKTITDPQAVFSMTPEAIEYRPMAQLDGPMLLAGDWTRTAWPATMEGAVLSGFAAAQQLLARWGYLATIVQPSLNQLDQRRTVGR